MSCSSARWWPSTREVDSVIPLPRPWLLAGAMLIGCAVGFLAGVALTHVDLRQHASLDPADPTAHYLTHKNYYLH